MYESLGIVETQGFVSTIVASGRQVISLTTAEQNGFVESDTILTKE